MGGNLEGVRAASLSYFGKEPAALDLAESALLVALPQSPVKQRPDRHALARQPGPRQGAGAHGGGRRDQRRRRRHGACAKACRSLRQPMPLSAPHLAQRLVLDDKSPRIVTHPRCRHCRRAAERLAAQERAYFDDGAELALVVVENQKPQCARLCRRHRLLGQASGQVDLAAAPARPARRSSPSSMAWPSTI